MNGTTVDLAESTIVAVATLVAVALTWWLSGKSQRRAREDALRDREADRELATQVHQLERREAAYRDVLSASASLRSQCVTDHFAEGKLGVVSLSEQLVLVNVACAAAVLVCRLPQTEEAVVQHRAAAERLWVETKLYRHRAELSNSLDDLRTSLDRGWEETQNDLEAQRSGAATALDPPGGHAQDGADEVATVPPSSDSDLDDAMWRWALREIDRTDAAFQRRAKSDIALQGPAASR